MWTPRILRPDYAWPCPIRGPIRTTTPATPYVPGWFLRKLTGYVHNALFKLSQWYCTWFGVTFACNNMPLPFGLVLKKTERVSIEEFAAMKMARAAGMPVPLALSCGEHYSPRHYRRITQKNGDYSEPVNMPMFSILMTRLPGFDLVGMDMSLEPDEDPWPFLLDLKECITAMRQWQSPYGNSICSVLGTKITSPRVPYDEMGPFLDQNELYDYLFHPASTVGFDSAEEYHETLAQANKLRDLPYRVTFTHGDFRAHNILIGDDGHLTGFLDWEAGSWCPEYWDFTTAMRWESGSWWYHAVDRMGGNQYRKELKYDKALNSLTFNSYAW